MLNSKINLDIDEKTKNCSSGHGGRSSCHERASNPKPHRRVIGNEIYASNEDDLKENDIIIE